MMDTVSPEPFYSQPSIGMTTSPTQMSQPDLFDFQVPPPPPPPNINFTLPERRHTAYARIERPVVSPTMPFTPPISQPQSASFEPSEETESWVFDEESVYFDSEEEEAPINGMAGLDANNIGPLVANNLHIPLDLYGTQVRSFHAFADENVLVNYTPSPTDTPLNDPKTCAVFWYFVTVTAPALNPYERNRVDPSRIFSSEPIPKSHQHIWSCKFADLSRICNIDAKYSQMSSQPSLFSTRHSFKPFSPWEVCKWPRHLEILRLLLCFTMVSVFVGTPKIIKVRGEEHSPPRWLRPCCLLSMKSGYLTTTNGARI